VPGLHRRLHHVPLKEAGQHAIVAEAALRLLLQALLLLVPRSVRGLVPLDRDRIG
jgi:hypothetical protein